MSLPLAIATTVSGDLALLAGLAWLMTRAAKLTPHRSAVRGAVRPAGARPARRPAQYANREQQIPVLHLTTP